MTQDADNKKEWDKAEWGKTRWWGQPALPEDVKMPEYVDDMENEDEPYRTPMTLICQINCADFKMKHQGEELAEMLPDKGLISVFAHIDYFLGDLDADSPYIHIGEWGKSTYRVVYSPDTSNLRLHYIMDENGEECSIEAEDEDVPTYDGEESLMLCRPTIYDDMMEENFPGYIALVQLDESDRHNLRFYDCGCLFFIIKPKDLKKLRFDRVKCVLCST